MGWVHVACPSPLFQWAPDGGSPHPPVAVISPIGPNDAIEEGQVSRVRVDLRVSKLV